MSLKRAEIESLKHAKGLVQMVSAASADECTGSGDADFDTLVSTSGGDTQQPQGWKKWVVLALRFLGGGALVVIGFQMFFEVSGKSNPTALAVLSALSASVFLAGIVAILGRWRWLRFVLVAFALILGTAFVFDKKSLHIPGALILLGAGIVAFLPAIKAWVLSSWGVYKERHGFMTAEEIEGVLNSAESLPKFGEHLDYILKSHKTMPRLWFILLGVFVASVGLLLWGLNLPNGLDTGGQKTISIILGGFGILGLPLALVFGVYEHFVSAPKLRRVVAYKVEKHNEEQTLFGKARAANWDEIQRAGFGTSAGLYVGRFDQPGGAVSVFYEKDRHAVTVAPNGSGKGRTVLIPHCAHWQESLIAMDIKGELAAITAQHRRDVLGQEVFILNPYGLFEDDLPDGKKGFRSQGFTAARFNPLAGLDASARDFTLRLDVLAADLVKIHDSKHTFWASSARQLVAGYLRYLVETKEPHERNICDLYGFFKRALVGGDAFKDELRGMFAESSARVYEELSCLHDTSGKIAEFLGTALSDWEFMRDDALRDTLSGDDFDFRNFKRRASSLFIVLPADGVKKRAMWLRLVVASGLSMLSDVQEGKGLNTLFLLDETPVLGHMECIAERFTLVRGYGVRFWLVVQSLQQLKEHYPDQWQTFLGNTGFQQFFTPNDNETAEYISKMSGNRTELNPSFNKDGENGGGYVGVPFLTPQEVRDMSDKAQVLFAPGLGYPVILKRGNYDKNPEYAGLNPNPYV